MDCVFLRFSRLLIVALGFCSLRLAAGNEPSTLTAIADVEGTPSQIPGHWTQIPGRARDIGVDARGVPWIVSFDEKAVGGYAIHKRTEATWSKVDGGAVKIAVAPNGDVWIVDDAGNVRFRKAQETTWTDMAGKARKISVAPDGVAWKIGSEQNGADYGVHKFNGSGWDKVDRVQYDLLSELVVLPGS